MRAKEARGPVARVEFWARRIGLRYRVRMSYRWLVALAALPACARASSAEPTPAPPVAAAAAQQATTATPVPEPTAVASPPPAPPAPAPAVDVRALGMHIGGGPNDDVTKAPFVASIGRHSTAFAQCWAALPARPTVDFGVDALVPGAGGRAKVDRPRSTVRDAAFVACATSAFAAIEFLPPKSGVPTKVSASLRLAARR